MLDLWHWLFPNPTFAHGIHPPEAKGDTCGLPIRQFPFAPQLAVPLSQHLGKPAVPIVREGQEVERGQCIAEPDGFMSVAMHAPATGVVTQQTLVPSILGRMVPALVIQPHPGSTQEVLPGAACDLETASADDIVQAIQQAGIVGLGGAGFPTHAKLRIPTGKPVDTLLINGAECEPYLTTDHRVMLEHAGDVLTGISYVHKAIGARRVIVAVEANKPDAAETLRREIDRRRLGSGQPDIQVVVLPVKYPQGAEKMLITALTGKQVPSGGLPLDVGVICINVSTAAEIGQLLPRGAGLQDRVITVAGSAIKRKGNYRVALGTPLRFILETVGVEEDIARVFLGGPMMGQAAASLDIPITKGTTGVIALTQRELHSHVEPTVYPCIRCGYCVDACPIFLNPSQMGLLAKAGRYAEMAEQYHLMDCFECGCCTYVCPSHIPLVQQFRVAKAAIRKANRV
ncbi:MAG: electron transport complex subunit RsxC [Pirellulaceae bacterium]|nr:electron transport complex subunit RsxC [Pirellulaceae bacterium]